MRHRSALVRLTLLAVAAILVSGSARLAGVTTAAEAVGERVLLDNRRVMMVEYVFPAGFRGEEHAAVADEFAYVLDGEFAVVTKGQGKRTLKPGEVEYATKGTLHYSLNESGKPSRVLVVLLK